MSVTSGDLESVDWGSIRSYCAVQDWDSAWVMTCGLKGEAREQVDFYIIACAIKLEDEEILARCINERVRYITDYEPCAPCRGKGYMTCGKGCCYEGFCHDCKGYGVYGGSIEHILRPHGLTFKTLYGYYED